MTGNRSSTGKHTPNNPALTDEAGEVRELTAEDFAKGKPISGFPLLENALERARGQRGPQKTPVKERVGLRLSAQVVEHFRNSGPGWQSRIDEILTEYVRSARNEDTRKQS